MELEKNLEHSGRDKYNLFYLLGFHGSYAFPILGAVASSLLYPEFKIPEGQETLVGNLIHDIPTTGIGYLMGFASTLTFLLVKPKKLIK